MIDLKSYTPFQYSDLIERVWVLENSTDDVEIYSPPSQYINLIIPLSEVGYYYNNSPKNTPHLEGLSLSTSVQFYPKGVKLLGVRFYPYALQSFFTMGSKAIINKVVDYDFSFTKQNSPLEQEVIIQLSKQYMEDKSPSIVKDFYWNFRGDDPIKTIEDFCESNATNYTSLHRLFSNQIGISPKKFERLIKFRKALCSIIDKEDQLTAIGLSSGYFDQAHFIREFKFFVGNTPSSFKKVIEKADQKSQIINYNFRMI
ncbi:AraC family transcriptional regulator [Flammeovirga sp. EKP202]|uniref:helix-turn-helix domain-containing protein n=1 Tax=Flammeovirga sp. EKP202 TaxID=2770592 RepID=UPI00165FDA49|nr:AraC family transcriptional regulator [Flammeovirga sp. EKP202]MBD0400717.1 helix-turn-helix transcriptional regulator [Flammeovirga sp. EKP202]